MNEKALFSTLHKNLECVYPALFLSRLCLKAISTEMK